MKRIFLLILPLLLPVMLRAEVIRLKSGKTVSGTILIQDEDVVILRDASGVRFQYPRTDIQAILTDDEAAASAPEPTSGDKPARSRKTTVRIELAGGMGCVPHEQFGGAVSGSLLIGCRQIAGREMALGGLVGYQGYFMPRPSADQKGPAYHFLPIALALRMPIIEGTHAPEVGASIGYGVALDKDKSYRGGVYVGADLGYRYLSPSGQRIYIGLYTHFQQATLPDTELVDGASYSADLRCALTTVGLKLAFSL